MAQQTLVSQGSIIEASRSTQTHHIR